MEALVVHFVPSVVQRVTVAGGAVVPLRWPRLGLVPVTDALGQASVESQSVPPGFYELTPHLTGLGASLSLEEKAAYIHLEFHGGTGFHAAMGWERGSPAWGPAFTTNEGDDPPYRYLPARHQRADWAVNQALRWLGVVAAGEMDEFEAAGLDAHRWTDEWLAAASS